MTAVMEIVDKTAHWCYKRLEESLLPLQGSPWQMILQFFWHLILFSLFVPISISAYYAAWFISFFFPRWPEPTPLESFAMRPVWNDQGGAVPTRDGQPISVGFSTADIQDSGPDKPQFQNTNWGDYYQAHKVPLESMPDTLDHPDVLIAGLKEIGVNHWRTSINLIPPKGSSVDQALLQRYCSFFRALKKAGIDLLITLNHDVIPDDFDWTLPESVDRYVSYVEAIAEPLYAAGVRKVLTTNECTANAMMGYFMGEYPPQKRFDLVGAALLMENMMKAHQRAYVILKTLHSDFQISLSHDPVRFRNYHKCDLFWAPIEKIVCYYLSEITHTALMRFFKTGKFSLKVPFLVNHQFEIREFAHQKTRPLDFFSINYYTDILLCFPWGSVTRVVGQKMSAYDYRMYPQGIATALEEASFFKIPIHISETGIDIAVNQGSNDEQRIDHFDKIFQATQKAIDHGVDVRSCYFWTKDLSWEWYKAMTVDFSLYNPDRTPRGAAIWLQKILAKAHKTNEKIS